MRAGNSSSPLGAYVFGSVLACFALHAWGEDGAVSQLAPVVVTATRTEKAAFDVPASIDRVDGDSVRDSRQQVNLSESLGVVPGLLVRDRQNYAQDLQLSIRGFGARSSFGIRGIRLYVDGIPATLPDGQGQLSNVELGSTDRIEVLRGPFSALYGNSSGGVIQIFTEEGRGAPVLTTSLVAGSDGAFRAGLDAGGSNGPFGYVVGASEFRTGGFRDHSAAERRIGNAKLTWSLGPSSKITLIANSVALPKAQDPMGLSRAEFEANPRSVDPSAIAFNTRKTVDQTQFGIAYEQRVDADNSWRLLVYNGHRDTQQFQAIPVATQANPLNPGGVITLGRDYEGADLRWSTRVSLGESRLDVVSGVAYDALVEARSGYQNFIGSTLGVQGASRRDETNHVHSVDPYVQGSLHISPRWTLDAGVRHSDVRFSSTDHYVVGSNPDDSGAVGYAATLPVAGLMFSASESVHLYATAGRGFETPTLNELAYRPGGGTGLNFELHPATSDSFEVGTKMRLGRLGLLNAALFETDTKREIVTLTNVAGRSTYENAGGTRRRGLELSSQTALADDWHSQIAYTLLDARYVDSYRTCATSPCASPMVTIPAGNRIPGIARQALYAAIVWEPPLGWRGGVEGRALSRVFVNDSNSDAAAGFAIAAAARRVQAASARCRHRRIRPCRQPVCTSLCRIGDRRRRQFTLLRAGSRTDVRHRLVGRDSPLGRRQPGYASSQVARIGLPLGALSHVATSVEA